MKSDIRARLAKVRALTMSPNLSEAQHAQRTLDRLQAQHGISDAELDDFIASYDPTPLNAGGGVTPEMVDFGLYIDGRQTKRLLYACVAYTVGWERWSVMRITRRHRKYIFAGCTRMEADYVREIFMLHANNLKAEQDRRYLTPEMLKVVGKSSRMPEIREQLDALTVAYINRAKLFPAGVPESKQRTTSSAESDRVWRMMRNMSEYASPARYERRMAVGGGRWLESEA